MHEYHFSFAAIRIRLQTPFKLKIGDESAPFLTENRNDSDLKVSISATESLPALPEEGMWIDDFFYTSMDQIPGVFVRNLSGESPYAFISYSKDEIRCKYIPGAEPRIQETSSILNLIGLEQVLLDRTGFLLHSSFIRYQDKAILFSAPCGVGKSTQAGLWEEFKNADIINGDRAGVRLIADQWTAFGMPFAGTSGIYRNESVPIAAIVTLAQGPDNLIRRLRPMEAARKLLSEISCRRWDGKFMNDILDLLFRVVQQIPVYHLECRPDYDAVEILHETLKKDGAL